MKLKTIPDNQMNELKYFPNLKSDFPSFHSLYTVVFRTIFTLAYLLFTFLTYPIIACPNILEVRSL